MKPLPEEAVIKRYQKAAAERDESRALFEEAIEYINPFKNTYNISSGHNINTVQQDSNPMAAAVNFVNILSKKFTPMFTRWAELKPGPQLDPNKVAQIEGILDKVNNITFAYIDSSNYAAVKSQVYFDLGISTGCYDIVEGDIKNPLLFVNNPLSSLSLSQRANGFVDAKFVNRQIKVGDLRHIFRNRFIMTDDLLKLEKDDPEREEEFIEAVYYNDEYMVWNYDVIHGKTKKRGFSESYVECPRITPRWMTIPGHTLGIGPFTLALSDIRNLNTTRRYELESAAFSTFGMYMVEDSSRLNPNNWVLEPGAFLTVERNGATPSVAPLPGAGNFQAQEFLINGMVDKIRMLMLDKRLPPESGQPKTAYEISERLKDLETDIGAALPQLFFEDVQPAMKRIVSILQRVGAYDSIPNLPQNFSNLIDNINIKISITSPISRAQSMQDVQALTQAMTLVQSLYPQMSQFVTKLPDVCHWIFERLGAPRSLLLEPNQIVKVVETLQQQTAQMMAQQQAAGQ